MKGIQIEKKMITLLVIVAVVVGVLGFFSGSLYTKHVEANSVALQGTGGQGRMGGNRAFGGRGAMGGFSGGQVIAKDATSITVQARDGSSKIIFFTANTPVMKMVAGQISDVVVGQTISVTGTPNPDGSITASAIQERPADPIQGTLKTQ